MKFVRLPKGTFQMGAPDGEKDAGSYEKPERRVTLTKDFYLGMYEVTQAEYEAVAGANPSAFKGPRRPVEQVSRDAATAFCEAMTKKIGRATRLPSEAEWEYACRAGTTTPFHWSGTLNGDRANCDGDYPYGTATTGANLRKTADVGSYRPNPWGLCDLHGNVWEWCRDYYGPYDKVVGQNNPVQLQKQSGNSRVLRGGSWSISARSCRAANRFWLTPVNRYFGIGFRVCLPLDD